MQLYLLVLALLGLEYVDADVRAAGRLLLAAREGRAHAWQQWLSLPMGPGYSDESGATWALHLSVPRQSCLRLEQGT